MPTFRTGRFQSIDGIPLRKDTVIMPLFEVCIDSLAGALAASTGGADRVELCSGLVEGGITPGPGLIRHTVERAGIDCVVLIRPRGGDFLYSGDELLIMEDDIRTVKDTGAHGIATGVLTAEGKVDEDVMSRLIEAARPMEVTFHRAFDMTREPFEALDTLIGLGIDRVLTSGQGRSVLDTLDMIANLVTHADGRITVMPGGGVREDNIREVLERTGAGEVHFTAFSRRESAMEYRNRRPMMGGDSVPGEYERIVTDVERVRAFLQAVS
ncbi:copper homeostasis protein CutC [Gemmatimonadota bacterium]